MVQNVLVCSRSSDRSAASFLWNIAQAKACEGSILGLRGESEQKNHEKTAVSIEGTPVNQCDFHRSAATERCVRAQRVVGCAYFHVATRRSCVQRTFTQTCAYAFNERVPGGRQLEGKPHECCGVATLFH